MAARFESRERATTQAASGSGAARRGRLLVLEPAPLLRWSLATYLARWFEVFSTTDRVEADKVLAEQAIDVMVLSDELAPNDLRAVRLAARRLNRNVRVVLTSAQPASAHKTADGEDCLEKPFDLSSLASLLGVADGDAATS